jgi:molybdate transport system permease protein
MRKRHHARGIGTLSFLLGGGLVLVLALPLVSLALSTSPADLRDGVQHPLFAKALWLSLRTTLFSVAVIVVTGTPLAWWLATSASRLVRTVELFVHLPIVIPPAVVGVALLETFGRQGLLGPTLERLDLRVPFTESAVVLAQVMVAAPFFIHAGANAFRRLDPDLLLVARTLGASPSAAFVRVAAPLALPGLVVGASLAWARALGEFGATLLFAGNMPGSTQTMPLAIFTALESDVRISVVFSLVLAGVGGLLLLFLRVVPAAWQARTGVVEPRGAKSP